MKTLRRLLPLLLVLSLAWAWTFPVQAHGYLLRSVPEANASLASSPAQVELYFSEAVDGKLSKLSVLDAGGKRVEGAAVRADPADSTHLSLPLPALGKGVYTVVWSVISATDGHQTSGSFPFAVAMAAPAAGSMPAQGAQSGAGGSSLSILAILAKDLLYFAAAALMGGILFTFAVWEASRRQAGVPSGDLDGYRKFSWKLALAALLVLVVGDVLSVLAQTGQVQGTLVGWPWDPAFLTVLFGTRVGLLAIARLAIAAVLAGLLLPRANGWNRWAALALSLGLLFTFSLESHAAAGPNPALPLLADWLHMLGVSVWVGGLFSFLGGMWSIRSLACEARTRLTAFLIPHFSTVAMASVGVLAATGLYASVLRLGSLDTLWSTPYGEALILKLAIAAPMLGLGAVNFLFTSPHMRKAAQKEGGDPGLVLNFRRLLSGEVALGVVILAWVGLFTSMPPAKVPSIPAGFNQVRQVDDLKIALNVDPGQPGMNTFSATITSGGRPVAGAQDVSLEFTDLTGMVPPAKAALTNQGNGLYRLQGGYLAMPDQWDVKVVVVRTGKFDAYADFKIDLQQGASPSMP